MPPFSAPGTLLVLLVLIAGAAVGWLLRSRRAAAEKAAIGKGWQTQIDAVRNENDRLAEQNRGLMEQVSEAQAAARHAKQQARDLSLALGDAVNARDELRRDVKAVRNNLESLMSEKQRLASEVSVRAANQASASELVERKDQRIARLKLELKKWQQRVPPLIERFREKNAETVRLEAELEDARERIERLEAELTAERTRVLPLASDSALLAANASNETIADLADVAEVAEVANVDSQPPDNVLNGDRLGNRGADTEFRLDRDDLKMIKGIGPAIEKTLNELGIVRFTQIAEMRSYDIERVARHLRGFRKRIEREDWIGQAEVLARQTGP